jgi:hypothetical protein
MVSEKGSYMRHWVVVLSGILCSSVALIYALTFNNSLDKKAEIDIFVSKEQPASVTFVSPITTNAEGRVASYSFFWKSSNKVMYWEHLYSRYLPTFLHPEMHVVRPGQKANTFSIALASEDIQDLAASELEQVFVTVRQRTYTYNASTGKLNFHSYVFLQQGLVPLDAVVT